MLYRPRKALLQILPIWTSIRIWASNQDTRFLMLSKGLITLSPTTLRLKSLWNLVSCGRKLRRILSVTVKFPCLSVCLSVWLSLSVCRGAKLWKSFLLKLKAGQSVKSFRKFLSSLGPPPGVDYVLESKWKREINIRSDLTWPSISLLFQELSFEKTWSLWIFFSFLLLWCCVESHSRPNKFIRESAWCPLTVFFFF